MRWFWVLALTAILSADASAESGFAVDLVSHYAQSQDFWKTIDDIQSRSGDIHGINQILEAHYGQPVEGFSSLQGRFYFDPEVNPEARETAGLYAGASAELLAGGEVRDPVFPVISAYAARMGLLEAGVARLRTSRESEWRFGLGATLGLGEIKSVQSASSEFIDGVPVRTGALRLAGADLDLAWTPRFRNGSRLVSEWLLRPTGYWSDVDPSTFVSYRWKFRTDYTFPVESGTEFTVMSINGPQPLPVDVLPRSWDYVHQLTPVPEPASLVGLGAEIAFLGRKSDSALRLTGGFFAGYPGGGVRLSRGGFGLSAGTWGVEHGSSYHSDGHRIWNASLEVEL